MWVFRNWDAVGVKIKMDAVGPPAQVEEDEGNNGAGNTASFLSGKRRRLLVAFVIFSCVGSQPLLCVKKHLEDRNVASRANEGGKGHSHKRQNKAHPKGRKIVIIKAKERFLNVIERIGKERHQSEDRPANPDPSDNKSHFHAAEDRFVPIGPQDEHSPVDPDHHKGKVGNPSAHVNEERVDRTSHAANKVFARDSVNDDYRDYVTADH